LQGKGYGTLLIKQMQQQCREAGIPLLWCHARRAAEGFYTRLGFTKAGSYFEKNNIIYCRMELPVQTTRQFTVIPAIDIIDGKCVRLTQGDYAQQKVYNEHPLEVAKAFEDLGVQRLHLVDLDGAKKGAVVNWKVLEAIAGKTGLVVDFGGGIKTEKDLDIVFESGAALATIGSIAVKDPELFFGWVKKYGPGKIFLGADVKEEKIAVGGWLETTQLSIYDFLEENVRHGVHNIFCTDIAKDGLLQGPSTALYRQILERFPDINFVASGGVSNLQDVETLREIGCSGAIVGKAIYEGRISMEELKQLIMNN
jgi:phosphoribosylformimino-5-aminoimidazole carboxamide ribotide isomerase